jgi:hypothetical protein
MNTDSPQSMFQALGSSVNPIASRSLYNTAGTMNSEVISSAAKDRTLSVTYRAVETVELREISTEKIKAYRSGIKSKALVVGASVRTAALGIHYAGFDPDSFETYIITRWISVLGDDAVLTSEPRKPSLVECIQSILVFSMIRGINILKLTEIKDSQNEIIRNCDYFTKVLPVANRRGANKAANVITLGRILAVYPYTSLFLSGELKIKNKVLQGVDGAENASYFLSTNVACLLRVYQDETTRTLIMDFVRYIAVKTTIETSPAFNLDSLKKSVALANSIIEAQYTDNIPLETSMADAVIKDINSIDWKKDLMPSIRMAAAGKVRADGILNSFSFIGPESKKELKSIFEST